MSRQDKYVIIHGAIVIWDGITSPEELKDGGYKYSLKVAIPSNSPELAEVNAIATEELQRGEFRGNLPAGAHWAYKEIPADKYDGRLAGEAGIQGITYNMGYCDVLGGDGKKLDAMMYANQIYPGAIVNIIVSARSYNNKSAGVGLWLNGIQIVDATAPRLPGSGGIDAAGMFGAQAGPPAPGAQARPPAPGAQAGPPAPPVAPRPEILTGPQCPAGFQMAGQVTYHAMVQAGWSDQQMIDAGHMIPDDVPF